MKQEIEKPLDEPRRTVVYLDGLQPKRNGLRELPSVHFEHSEHHRLS